MQKKELLELWLELSYFFQSDTFFKYLFHLFTNKKNNPFYGIIFILQLCLRFFLEHKFLLQFLFLQAIFLLIHLILLLLKLILYLHLLK